MSMGDRSEQGMTELVENIAAGAVAGWDEMNKFQQYQIKDQLLPLIDATVAALDAEPHKAKRGDEVEAWIKQHRLRSGPALDELLDDYRLHADTATPLSSDVDEMGG